MSSSIINRPVVVTAVTFGRGTRAYPRRIECDGTSYRFIDNGLRAVVKTGSKIAEILTMTDGENDFYLRREGGGGNWTLLKIA